MLHTCLKRVKARGDVDSTAFTLLYVAFYVNNLDKVRPHDVYRKLDVSQSVLKNGRGAAAEETPEK